MKQVSFETAMHAENAIACGIQALEHLQKAAEVRNA